MVQCGNPRFFLLCSLAYVLVLGLPFGSSSARGYNGNRGSLCKGTGRVRQPGLSEDSKNGERIYYGDVAAGLLISTVPFDRQESYNQALASVASFSYTNA